MKYFTTALHPAFSVGRTDPRLFGSFVEHMGSVVYNGIFQPGHPCANEKGWRMDVLELLKPLNLGLIRYPGGNYTSSYRWEDTVGPNRAHTLNFPWREMETNEFGLHDFFDWIKELGAEPMMTVNLGTRGALEAADVLEYCNAPGGTKFSEWRRQNGAEEPFDIKLWCLGNELDGEWQMGHKKPKEYGRLANITGQLMHRFDKNLKLACVGSSSTVLKNYPEWNRKVLMECFDEVDYITLHRYLNKQGIETPDYLCQPLDMENMIRTVIGACDYVAACKRSDKKICISFDEWNVGPLVGDGDIGDWPVGPMRDCISFTFEDALVFAGMFFTLLRHADRVKLACQSLIVNDLGLVMANDEGAYPNGTYPVFKLLSDCARGMVYEARSTGDTLHTETMGDQPALDVLTVKGEDGVLRVFAINRTPEEAAWTVHAAGLAAANAATAAQMLHAPLDARNSLDAPNTIALQDAEAPAWDGATLTGRVAPYSLTMWTVTDN